MEAFFQFLQWLVSAYFNFLLWVAGMLVLAFLVMQIPSLFNLFRRISGADTSYLSSLRSYNREVLRRNAKEARRRGFKP